MVSIAVGRRTEPAPPAKRLSFSAAEWAFLVGVAGVQVSAPFLPVSDVSDEERQAALGSLVARGVLEPAAVLGDSPVLVPAVVTTMTVLGSPAVVCTVQVLGAGVARHGWLTLDGARGVGLVTLADGGVELSVFLTQSVAGELQRMVPPVQQLRPAAGGIMAALTAGAVPAVPHGRVPLAALTDLDAVAGLGGAPADAGWTTAEVSLVRQLQVQLRGSLTVTVLAAPGDTVVVGRTTWLGLAGGWVGLRPDPQPSGRRMVRLVPVQPVELGSWVAPHLIQVLESGVLNSGVPDSGVPGSTGE